MKQPTNYVEGVLLGARRAPELINLLNLEQHFPHNVLKRFLTSFGSEGDALGMPKTAEMDCQVCNVCVGMSVCLCVCVSVCLHVCVRVSVLESDAVEMDCQVCNVCVDVCVSVCVTKCILTSVGAEGNAISLLKTGVIRC